MCIRDRDSSIQSYGASLVYQVFKQKTAYEIYRCDSSSDVCSSDLIAEHSREKILYMHEMAKEFEAHPNRHILDGKVVATLFFEPSTQMCIRDRLHCHRH